MHSGLRFARVLQANQFMLWDVEAEVELMSAVSGGWRRPFAVWLEGSDHFTVVLLKGHTLKILSRSRLAAAAEAPLKSLHAYARPNRAVCSADASHGDSESATLMHVEKLGEEEQMHAAQESMHARALVLMPPHHGKIVHACVCLQLSQQHVAVVTASEDGSVRVLTFRCAWLVSPWLLEAPEHACRTSLCETCLMQLDLATIGFGACETNHCFDTRNTKIGTPGLKRILLLGLVRRQVLCSIALELSQYHGVSSLYITEFPTLCFKAT
jgi:hypothetical protein